MTQSPCNLTQDTLWRVITRIAIGAMCCTALLTACAPEVTDPEAADGETVGDDVPFFQEGQVEHGEFVQPPLDPSRLSPVQEDRALQVVATVGQIADIAREIGGDRVSVQQIVPGNDDPHLYVPSPGDVSMLAEADLVLYNGLFLEGQMGETFERMDDLGIPTVAVTAGFDDEELLEREYAAGRFVTDPHVWFDPVLWGRAADNVVLALGALDPEGASQFEERRAQLGQRLTALEGWGRQMVGTIPEQRRVLVTSHDAFGYLGRRFGIEVRGLQGLSTEAEAGTKDVDDLVAFIIERDVPAVFVESSVSPKALRAVVEAVEARGGRVRIGAELFSDTPGVQGTAEGTYPGMVIWNLASIVAGLGGDPDVPMPDAVAEHPEWDYRQLFERALEEAREE